ncbi:MAG TPA: DUF1080 domain-containing protein, partial [Rhizomicrobium sp.]|nr:DUF1080 domain-containing protein [Rhizomicrobium sp.]
MKRIALVFGLLACASAVLAQTPPTPPPAAPGAAPAAGGRAARPNVQPTPYDFNDHPGWISMFDGKSLKGWDGPMDVWRVEDGTITASESASNPVGSVYLYWTGGKVKDFEFKTEIKAQGEGSNSGIQFRAIRLGKIEKKNSEYESRGYQADYTDNGGAVGSLIECCNGPQRGIPPRPGDSARRGFVVRTAMGEGQKPTVLATTGDPAELLKFFKQGDWNEIHLIVRGRTMMYIVNGHLMSVLVEDNPDPFTDQGEIAVQLEGRGD